MTPVTSKNANNYFYNATSYTAKIPVFLIAYNQRI